MSLVKGTKGFDPTFHSGNIDFRKVKDSGASFIIPRDGWGPDSEYYGKLLYADPKFFEYVKQAKDAGVEVPGIYHFIYAINMEELIQNAKSAIQNAEKAGLPKETYIWCDLEYNTVEKAKERGVVLTAKMQREFVETFCKTVQEAGYRTGIYCNRDYIENVYGHDIVGKYDIWLADLSGGPDYKCVFQQYNWKGYVNGCSEALCLDEYIGNHIADSNGNGTKEQEAKSMGKVKAFLDALETLGDGRYHYYDGRPMGIGCSEYIRQALVMAGVIREGETFHAGSGNRGVLTDTTRFDHLTFTANALKEGDIMWNQGNHVAAWKGDVRKSVYEAAPEKTHSKAECGTGVGLHVGHGTYNCGGGSGWTDIYRIRDTSGGSGGGVSGKPKSKEYVAGALALLDRKLAYRNSFPYNCGLLDTSGVTWGDCWNINPKTMIWSMYLGEPIWKNQITGEAHVRHIYFDGIKASGLQDVKGDYIMNNYCEETTFAKMIAAKKAPCFLLVNGNHMGAYIGEFVRDGKTYNVSEFSSNEHIYGKMRSYVDEYGRRWSYKGGEPLGPWDRCGYLTKFLDYSDWNETTPAVEPEKEQEVVTPEGEKATISAGALAAQIYAGKWGNNPARKENITRDFGADMYDAAQKIVDTMVSGMNWYRIEVKLAEEILIGEKWGVYPERMNKITSAYGANAYRIAQGFVNSICAGDYTIVQLKIAYDVAGGILSGCYGNGQERKNAIVSAYGETVRYLAQSMVNDILK